MKRLQNILVATMFSLSTCLAYGAASDTDSTNSSGTDTASNIRNSADDSSKNNSSGSKMNTIMGAANFGIAAIEAAECADGNGGACALSALYFAMGILNFKQASNQSGVAGQAAGTVDLTDTSSGSGSTAAADLAEAKGFLASAATTAAKSGMTYDAATGTVTAADGTSYKTSDASSAGSMAAAGVSKGMIDSISATENKLAADALKKANAASKLSAKVNGEEAGGGGGYGSGGGGSKGHGADPMLAGGAGGGPKLGLDRDPAQVAGMQKNYNGEPIGVAGDSIFKMMTRRYKVKESQSSFYEGAELLTQK